MENHNIVSTTKRPQEFITCVSTGAAARKSSRTIAEDLGRLGYAVTRNVVVGFCHRRGIALLGKPLGGLRVRRQAPPPSHPPSPPRPKIQVPKIAVQIKSVEPVFRKPPTLSERASFVPSKPVSIIELNDRTCHWPLGGFKDRPPYLYCGDPVIVCHDVTGRPRFAAWCHRHHQMSIQKPKETNRVGDKSMGAAA